MQLYYTQTEVAKAAKVSKSTFYNLVYRGTLPGPTHKVDGRRLFYTKDERDAIVATLVQRHWATALKYAELLMEDSEK